MFTGTIHWHQIQSTRWCMWYEINQCYCSPSSNSRQAITYINYDTHVWRICWSLGFNELTKWKWVLRELTSCLYFMGVVYDKSAQVLESSLPMNRLNGDSKWIKSLWSYIFFRDRYRRAFYFGIPIHMSTEAKGNSTHVGSLLTVVCHQSNKLVDDITKRKYIPPLLNPGSQTLQVREKRSMSWDCSHVVVSFTHTHTHTYI